MAKQNKTAILKLRLSEVERERLRATGVPMSKLVRKLLNQYFLKQRKNNNDGK
jgi:hypothetical protein